MGTDLVNRWKLPDSYFDLARRLDKEDIDIFCRQDTKGSSEIGREGGRPGESLDLFDHSMWLDKPTEMMPDTCATGKRHIRQI